MRAFLALTVAAALALTACGDDDDDDASEDSVATEVSQVAVSEDVPDIVGAEVEEATATLEDAGFTLRVVRRDGEDLAATLDYVPNRVNVAVETQDDGSEQVTELISMG